MLVSFCQKKFTRGFKPLSVKNDAKILRKILKKTTKHILRFEYFQKVVAKIFGI